MEINSKTLPTLYINIPSIEGKALQFLSDYLRNGQSARAMARELSIDRKTVAAILGELEDSPLWERAMAAVKNELGGFEATDFGNTLFQRYETEIKNLDKCIEQATDLKTKVSFMRVKHAVMRDELKAMLFFNSNNRSEATVKSENLLNKVFNDIIEENELNNGIRH